MRLGGIRVITKMGAWGEGQFAEDGAGLGFGKLNWGAWGAYGEISRRLLGDRFETQERSAAILRIWFSSA